MYERRGLQSLAGRLKRHFVRGEPSEFLVYKGEEFLGGLEIAVLDALEDLSDVAHGENAIRDLEDVDHSTRPDLIGMLGHTLAAVQFRQNSGHGQKNILK